MNNEIKDVFDDINNIFINKLQEAKGKINDSIEIELFNDCIDTYKRTYRLVDNNRLLDGIVLTRNAFELMMMLFGIRIDANVREEYCKEDSYECYLERRKINKKEKDYLSQSYLRKIILKKYKNIKEDYNKIYNVLSKFAHPTIHRNMLRFFERERVDVIVLYLNVIMVLPIVFLEILYEEKIVEKINNNLQCLIALIKSISVNTNSQIEVIATTIITKGDTMLADTAASPSINAPTILILAPLVLGAFISASRRISKMITKIMTSMKVGNGT